MDESRSGKSLKNAKVNLVFYFITLFLSFFSRKIFLNYLGADFMGLIGTLQSILGFLNLAELGIGIAIGYVLYKPIFQKNHLNINEIISVLGYLYRKIGQIILVLGAIIAIFIPIIFKKSGFPLDGIFFAYFSFLTSSLMSYFLNYKQTLLSADQKNYVIMAYYQTSNIIKILLQITVSYYTQNYYCWITLELIFGITYSIILNIKIKQVYPWLSSEVKEGKKILKKYPEVIQYTKQLFIHKIASFVQFQMSHILIFFFISLKTVAYYGNYTLIISKLSLLVNNIMDGTSAGVGNLIAEGDKTKIKRVFWELTSLRYYIGGLLVFALYHLIESFITLWLGKEFILDHNILVLILIQMYIAQTRGTNDMFLNGFGLFYDIWAPCTEALITLIASVIGGYFYGLAGIIFGSILGLLSIVGLWKPYFLYKKGFQAPLSSYWLPIFKFLAIFFVAWVISSFIIAKIDFIDPAKSYVSWTLYAVIVVFVFGIVQFLLMYSTEQGMRDLVVRLKTKFIK
ncbi:MAG: sugar transporter [Tissierellia bacterium]|nr:sugar transporter [Candidatus Cloacimonadota bacterium]MDD4088890.1 sugar transporter [Tissierellia bacterium]